MFGECGIVGNADCSGIGKLYLGDTVLVGVRGDLIRACGDLGERGDLGE